MELTYDGILDFLDVKYIAGSTTGYTMPPRLSEITDSIFMLKSLLLNKVKVKVTIDDIRPKTN